MALFPDIHRVFYRVVVLPGLLLLAPCTILLAQTGQRLPDSVSTADTVSPEISNAQETRPPVSDSTTDTANETRPDTTVFRAVPPAVVDAMKKDKDFAYANDPAFWTFKPVDHQPNFLDRFLEWLGSQWGRYFVYLLLGSILLFALYKIIVENKLYLFYSSPRREKTDLQQPEDLGEEKLDTKIKEAELSGDYRTSIRYHYLKLLLKAGEYGWIRFRAGGTDQEYILQMDRKPLGKSFRYLTNVYEYVWYGGFGLTPDQYQSLVAQFGQFYNFRVQ